MNYKNISKWLLVFLFVVGVITCAYGFINGWPDKDQWNKDNDVANTLPATIQSMKDAGTEVLSDAEIDAKKAEIDAVRAIAERNNNRLVEIKAQIDKAPEWRKKKVAKELQPETDSLTKEAHECNIVISAYNSAKELNKLEKQLAEVEARLAKGNASVNTILYSAYAMIAVVLIVLLIAFGYNWSKDPKALIKFAIVIATAGLLLFIAYKIAPNPTEAQVESYGLEGLTAGDIEMTDVLLYLTYLMFGATIAALVTSWVVGATRK
jgi:uncharacterized membrane protein YidH (DUF202 family)